MRFAVIFYISLMANLVCFSQKDSIIINGDVLSEENHPIDKARVHLISSKNHAFEYITDTTGKYRFHFYTDEIFTATISIASDRHTTAHKYRDNLGFQASKDTGVFILVPGKNYSKNFALNSILNCGFLAPGIVFNKNSITSCNDSLHKIDSAAYEKFNAIITLLFLTLKNEKNIVIEILGHASSGENNPDKLSLNRAEVIKQLLVLKGINHQRIITNGYGNKKMLVTDKIIKKAKTKEEKLALHLKNQRVVFRIINWDFTEDKK